MNLSEITIFLFCSSPWESNGDALNRCASSFVPSPFWLFLWDLRSEQWCTGLCNTAEAKMTGMRPSFGAKRWEIKRWLSLSDSEITYLDKIHMLESRNYVFLFYRRHLTNFINGDRRPFRTLNCENALKPSSISTVTSFTHTMTCDQVSTLPDLPMRSTAAQVSPGFPEWSATSMICRTKALNPIEVSQEIQFFLQIWIIRRRILWEAFQNLRGTCWDTLWLFAIGSNDWQDRT